MMSRDLFDPDHKFQVGDRVVICGQYDRKRGERWGTVTKVGRTLLHVTEDGFTRAGKYRLDAKYGRPLNSDFTGTDVRTPEEHTARKRRGALLDELEVLGWQPVMGRTGSVSNGVLQRFIDAIRREE